VVDGRRITGPNHPAAAFGNGLERVEGLVELRDDLDALVVAVPAEDEVAVVRRAIGRVRLVVCTGDSITGIRQLLALRSDALSQGTEVVIGAGFSPGLSCLLAQRAVAHLDEVEEIHVAKFGTGGPACARQHHGALGSWALEWRQGEWLDRPGGSGRELCWFPDPVGAADCYRAGLAEPILLLEAFPGLERAAARMAANRRDRFTAWLPMLSPPHAEGVIGAIRVEVRGRRGSARVTDVLGVAERPAVATAAVASAVAIVRGRGPTRPGVHAVGSIGSIELLDDVVEAGIRIHRFAGTEGNTGW
jgi:hypothetical protein